ncbi:hypothetical protein AOQ84DRAFT_368778 [Glonium stellatum]|uniref:Uncharacterized protein n=1 Tax=Glonium stellatum TaxID=574774 RepID=A0A8E2EQE3_9PEZI|nr:hypothetical protein AOQ84DRAFT_368778 [Glonium stellatum]
MSAYYIFSIKQLINPVFLTSHLHSSACSLFLEMVAGMRTVAVGDEPTTGPIKAVSGTRGAQTRSADAFSRDFEFAGIVNQTANSSLTHIRGPSISGIYNSFHLLGQALLDQSCKWMEAVEPPYIESTWTLHIYVYRYSKAPRSKPI